MCFAVVVGLLAGALMVCLPVRLLCALALLCAHPPNASCAGGLLLCALQGRRVEQVDWLLQQCTTGVAHLWTAPAAGTRGGATAGAAAGYTRASTFDHHQSWRRSCRRSISVSGWQKLHASRHARRVEVVQQRADLGCCVVVCCGVAAVWRTASAQRNRFSVLGDLGGVRRARQAAHGV